MLINNNVLHFNENCIQLSGHVKHLHGNFAHRNTRTVFSSRCSFCCYFSFPFFLFSICCVVLFVVVVVSTEPNRKHFIFSTITLIYIYIHLMIFVLHVQTLYWLCTCCRVVATATVSTATATVAVNAIEKKNYG